MSKRDLKEEDWEAQEKGMRIKEGDSQKEFIPLQILSMCQAQNQGLEGEWSTTQGSFPLGAQGQEVRGSLASWRKRKNFSLSAGHSGRVRERAYSLPLGG